MNKFLLGCLVILCVSQENASANPLRFQADSVLKGRAASMNAKFKIGIISTTDTHSHNSEQIASQFLEEKGHTIEAITVVDNLQVSSALEKMIQNENIQAILCIGGTGIAKNDVTVDALNAVAEKEIPGYGEYFRALTRERWQGYEDKYGLFFIDTRANAVASHGKIIFAVPGSPDATELAVNQVIIPGLPTLYRQIKR